MKVWSYNKTKKTLTNKKTKETFRLIDCKGGSGEIETFAIADATGDMSFGFERSIKGNGYLVLTTLLSVMHGRVDAFEELLELFDVNMPGITNQDFTEDEQAQLLHAYKLLITRGAEGTR